MATSPSASVCRSTMPSTPPTDTSTCRVIAVDDEPLARDNLRVLLDDDPEVETVAICGSGREAVQALLKEGADLLLLDVQMPDLDGFALLREIPPDLRPVIIFVTAYDQYAVESFNVNAVDFLLKPYDDARFYAALRRAKEQIRLVRADAMRGQLNRLVQWLDQQGGGGPAPSGGPLDDWLERVPVRNRGEIIYIEMDVISHFEADGDYVVVHAEDQRHLMREKLSTLQKRLDPRTWVRIHRSTIVRRSDVQRVTISAHDGYWLETRDGRRHRVGRSYVDAVSRL